MPTQIDRFIFLKSFPTNVALGVSLSGMRIIRFVFPESRTFFKVFSQPLQRCVTIVSLRVGEAAL